MDEIRGLSFTPPWPWAILRCGKSIENREGWEIPAYDWCRNYRGPIAIHASRLPTGVDSYWRRAMKTPSFTPRESQAFAIDDFEATVDGCMTAARAAEIEVVRPTLQQLCQQTGHIVGVATVIGAVARATHARRGEEPEYRVLLEARHEETFTVRELTQDERRWWFGGFALVLGDKKELKRPVPCKGALGLWPLPKDVDAQVRAQL